MLLNHPIDYLHSACVYVLCDGLWGGARRYMLMGPSVSKADSSFIRCYYTKQSTPTYAHTHKNYTQDTLLHKGGAHKAREQGASEPGCLGGWSVFISGIHLGWGRMMRIIITCLCSDSQYWWQRLSQYFILKGRTDWSSHSFPAFAGVKMLPQCSWKCLTRGVIYRRPGRDVGKAKCELSAQVETSLDTARKEAKWCYHQQGLELKYKTVQRVSDFCPRWGEKCRNLFILSGRSKQTRTDETRTDKTGGKQKRREENRIRSGYNRISWRRIG